MKWAPWQTVVQRAARSHGFLDPFPLLARLQQFSQPSEVQHPIQLLRAGAWMHARGLLNARIIQYNLDWAWPYWVQRQFNPHDDSFVPRAFSLTNINLTHRNWTAIGLPDIDSFPIVDPAGLVTPHWDSWSVDFWLRDEHGRWLRPASCETVTQTLDLDQGLAVVTMATAGDSLRLTARAEVVEVDGNAWCSLEYVAYSAEPACLVIALRPFNPEGVSRIDDIHLEEHGPRWVVDGACTVELSEMPDHHLVSRYHDGDVFLRWDEARAPERKTHCDLGMATAAAGYRVQAGAPRTVALRTPLVAQADAGAISPGWSAALAGSCALEVPDPRFQKLFETAKRTLILLSPLDPYPGPYTYKRFWFRDAAYFIDALLALGLGDRAVRAVKGFKIRQDVQGYFLSQDGEWDSNGEALWVLDRTFALTNTCPDAHCLHMVRRGAQWIIRKRLPSLPASPHAGLMPPGFSAEHLGPNDYYYWDDFWSVAGLLAAARLCRRGGDPGAAAEFGAAAHEFKACIDRSLSLCEQRLGRPAMPAAPYRRLDAGAIGSIVAGYPLQIMAPDDTRLLDTARHLLGHCQVGGGFFQDMIHSGINPYLTLHLAQVLLRAGDKRYLTLMDTIADLASPTGQWPEAIHPRTRGGCMGDGQHSWAAAEWILMLRNCFVREEAEGLVIAAGIPAEWLAAGAPIRIGPAPTPYGPISVSVSGSASDPAVSWNAAWWGAPPTLSIALPGYCPARAAAAHGTIQLTRRTI